MPDIMTSRAFQKFEVKWFTVAWRSTMIQPTLNRNSIRNTSRQALTHFCNADCRKLSLTSRRAREVNFMLGSVLSPRTPYWSRSASRTKSRQLLEKPPFLRPTFMRSAFVGPFRATLEIRFLPPLPFNSTSSTPTASSVGTCAMCQTMAFSRDTRRL